jgi:hypothetical protein
MPIARWVEVTVLHDAADLLLIYYSSHSTYEQNSEYHHVIYWYGEDEAGKLYGVVRHTQIKMYDETKRAQVGELPKRIQMKVAAESSLCTLSKYEKRVYHRYQRDIREYNEIEEDLRLQPGDRQRPKQRDDKLDDGKIRHPVHGLVMPHLNTNSVGNPVSADSRNRATVENGVESRLAASEDEVPLPYSVSDEPGVCEQSLNHVSCASSHSTDGKEFSSFRVDTSCARSLLLLCTFLSLVFAPSVAIATSHDLITIAAVIVDSRHSNRHATVAVTGTADYSDPQSGNGC